MGAYQKIKATGLRLSLLSERHKEDCSVVWDHVKVGAIWVYPELMQGYELIGQVFYVCINHKTHRAICLEVDYPERTSATCWALKKYEAEKVHLKHALTGAGPFGHRGQIFDLITEPMSPEFIRLIGSWDLVEFIKDGVTV